MGDNHRAGYIQYIPKHIYISDRYKPFATLERENDEKMCTMNYSTITVPLATPNTLA